MDSAQNFVLKSAAEASGYTTVVLYLREIQRQVTLLTMFSLRQILNIPKHSYKFGYKSTIVSSLCGRGGGWCNNLMSGVRVNEEKKKQGKISIFTLSS